MPRYKPVNLAQDTFVPVCFDKQILPGTFKYALHHLMEHRVDLSASDSHYANEHRGVRAYDPKVLLKIVLFACSRGIIGSRRAGRTSSSWHCQVKPSPIMPPSPPLSAAPLKPYNMSLRKFCWCANNLAWWALSVLRTAHRAEDEAVRPGAQYREAGALRVDWMRPGYRSESDTGLHNQGIHAEGCLWQATRCREHE